MKKLIALLLVLVLIIACTNTILANDSIYNNQSNTVCLVCNTGLMDRVFTDIEKNHADQNSTIVISLNEQRNVLNLALYYRGQSYLSELFGDCVELEGANYKGYSGIYNGTISSKDDNNQTKDVVPITANLIESEGDTFCALTIDSNDGTPLILFYGERTEAIKELSALEYEEYLANDKESMVNNEPKGITVNGEMAYQGSRLIVKNGRPVASIHFYHAPELRNQGSMTVRLKMNTSSFYIGQYIQTDLGYGSNYAGFTPTRIELSIRGYSNLHSTGVYTPTSGTTSFNMVIPYYIPNIGIGTVTFPITLSSTSVSTSAYPSSSYYTNNKVYWTLKKTAGWGSTAFEGNQNSQTGMTVSTPLTYEGNVTSSFFTDITYTGLIQIKYYVLDGGDIINLSFTPSSVSTTSTVTIVP